MSGASPTLRICGSAFLALLATVAGFGALAAAAGENSRQTADSGLTAQRTAGPTGTRTAIDYFDPGDRGGKPPAVRKVELRLPRGTRIDTSVSVRCKASDAELMAQGADACPKRSSVGGGFLRLDTGVPGPGRYQDGDVKLLNNDSELIFLSTTRDGGAHVVTRAKVRGRTIVTGVPVLPGAPPDGAALDKARTHLERITVDGHAYIRTPAHCPPRGHWTVRHRFTYDDGVIQVVRSPTPCRDH
jgi:hypothetical protein